LITFSSASSLGPASFAAAPATDQTLICFSHLRWNFRVSATSAPESRFTKERRVIYWEEPEVALPDFEPSLACASGGNRVIVVTPSLPEQITDEERSAALKSLLDGFLAGESKPLIRWYYTPMMLPFSRHIRRDLHRLRLHGRACQFPVRPAELLDLERELLAASDVVFTGGYSLYEARRGRHPNVHPFPSERRPQGISRRPATATAARPTRRHRDAALRLLRRDRRAHGPGADRGAGRRASRNGRS
jgi:UDP-galactopyranose mutase